MSAEQCQGSCRNDRLKVKRILWGIGNFYRCRLQILVNLSGKHFGWNGMSASAMKSIPKSLSSVSVK